MARYIDAENMYKEVWKHSTSPLNEWDTWGLLSALERVPTADVEPVIHAHWTYEIDDLFPADSMMICSNCGEYERLGANDNYCGNCGAKMDEEVAE